MSSCVWRKKRLIAFWIFGILISTYMVNWLCIDLQKQDAKLPNPKRPVNNDTVQRKITDEIIPQSWGHDVSENTNVRTFSKETNMSRNVLEGAELQPQNRHKMVLMVTHYRSGSTFMGELFAQNPDAFYWYEPLHSLARVNFQRSDPDPTHVEAQYVREQSTDGKLNVNQRLSPLPDPDLSRRTWVLNNTLTCQPEHLQSRILTDSFMRKKVHMPRMGPYSLCLKSDRTSASGKCISTLQHLCDSSQIVVAKVIRYPLHAALSLLAAIPHLYIIFYVRDPRGVMSSRRSLRRYRSIEEFDADTSDLCDAMLENYHAYTIIRDQYPNNIMLLQYEDLALNPEDEAMRIYKFVGEASVPDAVLKWLDTNTKAGGMAGGKSAWKTVRNSTKTATDWRNKLRANFIYRITQRCRAVLAIFGFEE